MRQLSIGFALYYFVDCNAYKLVGKQFMPIVVYNIYRVRNSVEINISKSFHPSNKNNLLG